MQNETAWEPESAAELAELVETTEPDLADAFAATELAPRVAAVGMLAAWARAACDGGGNVSAVAMEAAAAQAAVAAAWHHLLALATKDAELRTGKYSVYGLTHRRKVRIWQALTVLTPAVAPTDAEAAAGPLIEALGITNAASVRQYLETCLLALIVAAPHLLRVRLLPLLRQYVSAKADCSIPSLILIGCQAAVLLQPEHHPLHRSRLPAAGALQPAHRAAAAMAPAAAPEAAAHFAASGVDQRQQQQQQQREREQAEWEALLRDVTLATVPWSLSHPHPSRSFAQLLLRRLYELWPSLLLTDDTAQALWAFLTTNQDLERLRKSSAAEEVLTRYRCVCLGGRGGGGWPQDAKQWLVRRRREAKEASLLTRFEMRDMPTDRLDVATSPKGVFAVGVQLLGQREESGCAFEGAPIPLLDVVSLGGNFPPAHATCQPQCVMPPPPHPHPLTTTHSRMPLPVRPPPFSPDQPLSGGRAAQAAQCHGIQSHR